MKIKKVIKNAILALGIPAVATYLWIKAYGWLYFIPQGELRMIDTLVPGILGTILVILWAFGVMYLIGSRE